MILLSRSVRSGDPVELPVDDVVLEDGGLSCSWQHCRYQARSSNLIIIITLLFSYSLSLLLLLLLLFLLLLL